MASTRLNRKIRFEVEVWIRTPSTTKPGIAGASFQVSSTPLSGAELAAREQSARAERERLEAAEQGHHASQERVAAAQHQEQAREIDPDSAGDSHDAQ